MVRLPFVTVIAAALCSSAAASCGPAAVLKLASAGHLDGNTASITLNDIEAVQQATTGLNVAVLDGITHELLDVKSFDTFRSWDQADALAICECPLLPPILPRICRSHRLMAASRLM